MDAISSDSWERIWDLARALWPRWKTSIEQESLWRRRLEVYSEQRIATALEEVLIEHPVLTPRLAWIISKLRGSLSDAPNKRAQMTGYPATPEEADEVEREIIAKLRAFPPSPSELDHAIKCFLYWKSGDKPTLIQVHVVRDAATPKPYEIWPQGLVGLVWAAMEAAKKREQRPACDVDVIYEPGSIEVEEPAYLQQGGG